MSLTNLVSVIEIERTASIMDRDGILKSIDDTFNVLRSQVMESFAARDKQLAAIIGADEPQQQPMQEAAE